MAQAWKVRGLRPDARFREAAGRVILTRWAEMMSFREGVLAGEDIEELHAMRVSSRRLRAAMDAFAAVFPPRAFARRLKLVKRITDTLGDARDLDVTIESLTAMLGELRADERPGIEGLISRYRQERAGEQVHIAAMFAELEADESDRRFCAWVEKHTGIAIATLRPRAPAGER